jgi:hypothetical protein
VFRSTPQKIKLPFALPVMLVLFGLLNPSCRSMAKSVLLLWQSMLLSSKQASKVARLEVSAWHHILFQSPGGNRDCAQRFANLLQRLQMECGPAIDEEL